ncbi:MAG: nuclear transport factor 2 family protein [Thermoproteota archaeon]|nr:nuclear transport factor 2 family protein [Thermoproteota archaeon]
MFNSMTEQDENIPTVNKLYDALRCRDISSLLDMFTDDAILHGPTSAGVLPWGGLHKGRRGVAECFTAVGESLKPQEFEYGTLLLKATKLPCLDIKRGKPSLQDDHTRSSLYIYGQYKMENSQDSGYSMIQLP